MIELRDFDNLEPMDQLILHGSGLFAKATEAVEAGWATHTATALNPTQVFEALAGGMTLSSLASYRPAFEVGHLRAFRPGGSLAAKKAARDAFYLAGKGRPYAFPELLGFLFVLGVRRLLRRDVPNPLPASWVCSEANCWGLRLLFDELSQRREWDARNALEPVWLVNPNNVDPEAHLEFCATGQYPSAMYAR